MPKTMYFIKVQMADGSYEYKQITGKEFYSLVSTEEGKSAALYGWPGTIKVMSLRS